MEAKIDIDLAADEGRDSRGRFAAGHSGNPLGRARGSRNARTVELSKLLDAGGDAIVKTLVQRAKDGQPWALRLAIERLLPKFEHQVQADLGSMASADEVAEATLTVLSCMTRGEFTLEESKAMLNLIEQRRRAIETSDLAVRLELLERGEAAPPIRASIQFQPED